jgi:hypothetical protein
MTEVYRRFHPNVSLEPEQAILRFFAILRGGKIRSSFTLNRSTLMGRGQIALLPPLFCRDRRLPTAAESAASEPITLKVRLQCSRPRPYR